MAQQLQSSTQSLMTPTPTLNTPLSLHFYCKYIKMYLLNQVISDPELLTIITQFLDINSLLDFSLTCSKFFMKIYGIQSIELRIVKAKLQHYEKKAKTGEHTWNNYTVDKWSEIEHSRKRNVVMRIKFGKQGKKSGFIFNFGEKNLKVVKDKSSVKLEQLKKVNNRQVPAQDKKEEIDYLKKFEKKRIRNPSPEMVGYRQKMRTSFEMGINKTAQIINSQKEGARINKKKANIPSKKSPQKKNTQTSPSNLVQILTCAIANQNKQNQMKKGIRVPQPAFSPQNIVLREQTFIDRVRDSILKPLFRK